MNPLFRNAQKALQDAAKKAASAANLAKTLRGMKGAATPRNVSRVVSRSTSQLRQRIVDSVMKQLGPLGSVITALLRPNGEPLTRQVEQEAAAAANLLTQLGYQVTAPQEQPTTTVQPGGGDGKGQPPRSISTFPTETDGEVSVVVGRRERRYSLDDPIMTGEMIEVTSSNVHSIGFGWNPDDPTHGTLRVRFLQKSKGGGKTAGPLYYYHDVHPDVFRAFQVAQSKGKFVWDELRVRGTVSGHQYRYDLAGTGDDGYIPRQAGLKRNQQGEFYLQRRFQGRTSQLPEQHVRGPRGALSSEFGARVGEMNLIPNRGRPNRGEPNRGRPNRGR